MRDPAARPNITCPRCGHAMSSSLTYCLRCGTRLPAQPQRPRKLALLYGAGFVLVLLVVVIVLTTQGFSLFGGSGVTVQKEAEAPKRYAASDGSFSGVFDGLVPLETVKTGKADYYDVISATLSNGKESITRERNIPYQPIEPLTDEQIQDGLLSVVNMIAARAGNGSSTALQKAEPIAMTLPNGSKLPGIAYYIAGEASADAGEKKGLDIYGRVYFAYHGPQTGFSMFNLMVQTQSAPDTEKKAAAFFDSCIIAP